VDYLLLLVHNLLSSLTFVDDFVQGAQSVSIESNFCSLGASLLKVSLAALLRRRVLVGGPLKHNLIILLLLLRFLIVVQEYFKDVVLLVVRVVLVFPEELSRLFLALQDSNRFLVPPFLCMIHQLTNHVVAFIFVLMGIFNELLVTLIARNSSFQSFNLQVCYAKSSEIGLKSFVVLN